MASIFTKIVNGEIPCYKVAETEEFLAFLDINPISKGHTLVIPKIETDYFFDLDNETLSKIILFSKQVERAVRSVIPCKRIGLVVYGLDVPHAHIHLIPIVKGNEINFTLPKEKLTGEEFAEIASEINLAFLNQPAF